MPMIVDEEDITQTKTKTNLSDTLATEICRMETNGFSKCLIDAAVKLYTESGGVRIPQELEDESARYENRELVAKLPYHSPSQCINGLRFGCVNCVGYYLR